VDLHTKAVHSGDRRKAPAQMPSTTPVYTAASYSCDTMEQLDAVFGRTEPGYCYARYDNPSSGALEEQVAALENGHGALACATGMTALHMALLCALTNRPRSVLAADALYGATVGLLLNVLKPTGVGVHFVDFCDLEAVRRAVAEEKPGCILAESVSNPLLRVAPLDGLAAIAREAGAAFLVDNTFATPLLVRPMELGANFTVHSLTKFLSGHGDVLGGVVVSDAEHYTALRAMARTVGPNLGPFECFLAMRGIKTFPLRMERHCANAVEVARWLKEHPRVERVHFPGDPQHPDTAVITRLLPKGLYGGMISFELRGAGRAEVFRFMDALKLIFCATSLGDVHSIMLYPAMSSHRDLGPARRAELGIGDNLVRLSVGIEGCADIVADLDQALANL
jgi:cystathionine beta-lyase/cystathionine gamma-synthase